MRGVPHISFIVCVECCVGSVAPVVGMLGVIVSCVGNVAPVLEMLGVAAHWFSSLCVDLVLSRFVISCTSS